MFIKQERPALLDQYVLNNRFLRGGQQQSSPGTDQVDEDVQAPVTATAEFRFQPRRYQQNRRIFKTQYRRYPQVNQLTQQDIIAWAQGLSHPHQVQGCHPQRRSFAKQQLQQQSSQVVSNQPQQPQQSSIKMDDGKNFSYIVNSDHDCWAVGDSFGSEFFSNMSTYSTSNDTIHQTMGGYHVSGRDLGPGQSYDTHQHHLNKADPNTSSLQHLEWPTFRTTYADKYSPPPFAPIESECPRQQSMPAIFGDPASTNYMSMHHGLESNVWASESSMPILGEAILCGNQVSPPNTTFSSFSLSSASDAMASMSIDTPMGNHNVVPADMISCHSTISPKVLRINPSPAPTSSSDSARTALFPNTMGEFPSASSLEQQYLPPNTSSSKHLTTKGRKALPEKPLTRTNYTTSMAQSENMLHRRSAEKRSTPSIKHLADIKPKPHRTSCSVSPEPEDQTLCAEAAERNKQNEFLVQSKLAGKTYREIKREGGFKEAESTLRGRYRTLTKPKVARVRKPEWTGRDLELLKKAVHKLTKGADSDTVKIPWKQVSAYIAKNGGSYNFGYSTCSKRWDELILQEE